jgi:putative copper resistance protein D
MNAVDSLAIHLVGVCLWVGGLGALVLIARRLGDQLQVVVTRYSSLALWCFIAVAASGVINALLRLGSLRELASGYGLLVLGKAAALGLLGLAGLAHRTRTIRQLPDRPRLFFRLAAVEVMVMGATIGLAVALSRSAPPASGTEVDPVALLLGFPPPPPLTVQRYVFSFYPDVLWLTIAGLAAALYVAGVIRLRRRGDSWTVVTAGVLAGWLRAAGPDDQRWTGDLRQGPFLHTHAAAHGADDGGPAVVGTGCPCHVGVAGARPRTDGSLGARRTAAPAAALHIARFLGNPITAECSSSPAW